MNHSILSKIENDRSFIIMMTGPSLSMKSAVASDLSKYLRISLIDSACFGSYPFIPKDEKVEKAIQLMEPIRKKRHEKMKNLVKAYINEGLSFIIDSAFSSTESREYFYRYIETIKEQTNQNHDLILLWCHCDDENIIKYRFEDRQSNILNQEKSTTHFGSLKKLRELYQPPKDNNGYRDSWTASPKNIELIKYDTGKFTTKIFPESKNSKFISETIEQFIQKQRSIGAL